jgi:hypothetical protein
MHQLVKTILSLFHPAPADRIMHQFVKTFFSQARQRRSLAAQQVAASRADPDAKTQGSDAGPADVFAGYVPIRQTRKRQKTKRKKREERAAAEAAARRALETGVNGDRGTEPGVNGDRDAEPPEEASERAGVKTPQEGGEARGDPGVNTPRNEGEPGGAQRGESARGGDADADVSMTIAENPAEEERQVGRGGEADVSRPPPVVPIPDVFTSDESFQLLYEVVKGLADVGRVQKASGIVQRLLLFGKNAPPGKRLSAEQRRQLKQLTLGEVSNICRVRSVSGLWSGLLVGFHFLVLVVNLGSGCNIWVRSLGSGFGSASEIRVPLVDLSAKF